MPEQAPFFLLTAWHSLCHFLLIFFGKHWVLAFTNAAMTALLGLGLIAVGRRWRALRLSPLQQLRLRRSVLIIAAIKGAATLVIGEGYPKHSAYLLQLGLQFPDPREVFGFVPRTVYSIWYPTSITARVSIVLLGLAGISLFIRALQVWRAERILDVIARLEADKRENNAECLRLRVHEAFNRAALQMALPVTKKRPAVLLVDLPGPTPILLGLRRPRVLLSPHLAERMTDEEIEVALRHELAHFLRRDHWWRWGLTWIVDIGRVTGAVVWLTNQAGALEEQLCDRLAIRTVPDAAALASALAKATEIIPIETDKHNTPDQKDGFPTIPAAVVPSLVGRPSLWQSDPHAIRGRLEHLVDLIKEPLEADNVSTSDSLTPKMTRAQQIRRVWQLLSYSGARTLFLFFLFVIVYIKYYFYLNVF